MKFLNKMGRSSRRGKSSRRKSTRRKSTTRRRKSTRRNFTTKPRKSTRRQSKSLKRLNEYEPRYRNAAEKNAKWSKRDFEIYNKCNTWYRNWLIYRDPVMLLKDYKKISKDPDYKKYCYPEPREKKNARRTAERMVSRK